VIVFPAVDLHHGLCVRLTQGDPAAETVYSEDPLAVARRWAADGAQWLHIVNLDGAFAGHLDSEPGVHELPTNLTALQRIAQMGLPIQFGGGLRSLNDIEMVLGLGAQRIVLGTAAVANPDLVAAAVERFGSERIAVGIDARQGLVSTHGWQQMSEVPVIDLAREMRLRGVDWVVYTDIARDGMLSGVNASATASLARQTRLRVIASGGVASLRDICTLKQVEASGVSGVIIGRALYTGAIDLPSALAIAHGNPAESRL
jgi:phosphoribosylformimino-5-aminoimidazole carboxamide ribotide isomerase